MGNQPSGWLWGPEGWFPPPDPESKRKIRKHNFIKKTISDSLGLSLEASLWSEAINPEASAQPGVLILGSILGSMRGGLGPNKGCVIQTYYQKHREFEGEKYMFFINTLCYACSVSQIILIVQAQFRCLRAPETTVDGKYYRSKAPNQWSPEYGYKVRLGF